MYFFSGKETKCVNSNIEETIRNITTLNKNAEIKVSKHLENKKSNYFIKDFVTVSPEISYNSSIDSIKLNNEKINNKLNENLNQIIHEEKIYKKSKIIPSRKLRKSYQKRINRKEPFLITENVVIDEIDYKNNPEDSFPHYIKYGKPLLNDNEPSMSTDHKITHQINSSKPILKYEQAETFSSKVTSKGKRILSRIPRKPEVRERLRKRRVLFNRIYGLKSNPKTEIADSKENGTLPNKVDYFKIIKKFSKNSLGKVKNVRMLTKKTKKKESNSSDNYKIYANEIKNLLSEISNNINLSATDFKESSIEKRNSGTYEESLETDNLKYKEKIFESYKRSVESDNMNYKEMNLGTFEESLESDDQSFSDKNFLDEIDNNNKLSVYVESSYSPKYVLPPPKPHFLSNQLKLMQYNLSSSHFHSKLSKLRKLASKKLFSTPKTKNSYKEYTSSYDSPAHNGVYIPTAHASKFSKHYTTNKPAMSSHFFSNIHPYQDIYDTVQNNNYSLDSKSKYATYLEKQAYRPVSIKAKANKIFPKKTYSNYPVLEPPYQFYQSPLHDHDEVRTFPSWSYKKYEDYSRYNPYNDLYTESYQSVSPPLYYAPPPIHFMYRTHNQPFHSDFHKMDYPNFSSVSSQRITSTTPLYRSQRHQIPRSYYHPGNPVLDYGYMKNDSYSNSLSNTHYNFESQKKKSKKIKNLKKNKKSKIKSHVTKKNVSKEVSENYF